MDWHKRQKRILFSVGTFFIIYTVLLLFIQLSITKIYKPDFDEPGFINISSDRLLNEIVELSGRWKYVDITHEVELSKVEDETMNAIQVPSLQHDSSTDHRVYFLEIKLDSKEKMYGLRFEGFVNKSSVYIDQIDTDHLLLSDIHQPVTKFFQHSGNSLRLFVIEKGNTLSFTGIDQPIYFGHEQNMLKLHNFLLGYSSFSAFCGLLFMVSLLLNFIIDTRNKKFLLLSFIFLFIGLYDLLNGEKILTQLFEDLTRFQEYKISAVLQYSTLPLLYLFSLHEQGVVQKKRWFKHAIVLYGVVLIHVLFIPLKYFMFYCVVLWGFIALWFVCITRNNIEIIRSDLRKKQFNSNTLLLVVGCIIGILILVLRTLHDLSIIHRNTTIYYSQFAFIFILYSIQIIYYHKHVYEAEYLTVELKKNDEHKSQFLFRTTHELSSTIKAIQSITDLMLDSQTTNLTERQTRHLSFIKMISNRLSHLVMDINDLAAIQNGRLKIELKEVNLRYNIELIASVFHFSAIEYDCTISYKVGNWFVIADENRLRQVFYYLMENTLKHTRKGHIRIEGYILNQEVMITLKDTGYGMTKEEEERVQRLLSDLDETEETNQENKEYGLLISKQLIRMMNGQLRLLQSDLVSGSEFEIRLPLALNAKEDCLTEYAIGNGQNELIDSRIKSEEGMIILHENDSVTRYLISNLLRQNGFQVVEVVNVDDVIECIKKHRNVLVLVMDIMSSNLLGLQVLKSIRKIYNKMELPILMTLPVYSSNLVKSVIQGEANDFFIKPFNEDVLMMRVESLISIHKEYKSSLQNELAFLQAQIKPHFLYNALSVIASKCVTDGTEAARLLVNFSKFLRFSFDQNTSEQLVLIRSEISILEAYISLEKARFEERVTVIWDVDETLMDFSIPPLLIQPLVENAIRHGICKRYEGGVIFVSILSDLEGIVIKVSDNGIGIEPEILKKLLDDHNGLKGIGLRNVQKRLLLFKGSSLSVDSTVNQGTTVIIHFPI